MGRSPADPFWQGIPLWYAFLAGIAAGSYALAGLAAAFGRDADRRATRAAHYLAFPLAAGCGAMLFLAVDPARRFIPGLALAAFGVFSLASFLATLRHDGWLGEAPGATPPPEGTAFSAAGAVVALAFGATTGMIFPEGWAGPAWVGALLLASAFASGVSAVVLANRWRKPGTGDEALERLGHVNALAIVVELALLTALALSLRGPTGGAFMSWPGMLIPLFVVPVGMVFPLIVGETERGEVDVALLVLLGRFVLCAAVAGIHAAPHYH